MSDTQDKNDSLGKKDKKKERLAEQLRANLKKRKAQLRTRQASEASRDDMDDKE